MAVSPVTNTGYYWVWQWGSESALAPLLLPAPGRHGVPVRVAVVLVPCAVLLAPVARVDRHCTTSLVQVVPATCSDVPLGPGACTVWRACGPPCSRHPLCTEVAEPSLSHDKAQSFLGPVAETETCNGSGFDPTRARHKKVSLTRGCCAFMDQRGPAPPGVSWCLGFRESHVPPPECVAVR